MIQYFTKKINNKKGFTLVELIIVVAILGVLSMLAVPKFTKSRKDAAIAVHDANVRTLESAATLAKSEGKTVDWSDDNENWKDYLQDWPEIPKELKDEEDKNGNKVEGKYTVKENSEGKIIVTPGRIKPKASGEGEGN